MAALPCFYAGLYLKLTSNTYLINTSWKWGLWARFGMKTSIFGWFSWKCWFSCPKLVPEIIDPVFAKTSQNAHFLFSEYERFGLVFTKTRVYKFGHRSLHTGTVVRMGTLTRRRVCPLPPLVPVGRNTLACGRGSGGIPIRTRGRSLWSVHSILGAWLDSFDPV